MTGSRASRNLPNRCARRAGFSLIEALVAISILGVVLLFSIPTIGSLVDGVERTRAKQNARTTAGVSGALSSAGVAHVLPESLGGAEATVRLLRRGITVPEGPLAGTFLGMPNLAEEQVAPTAVYLRVVFDQSILRMTFNEEPES